MKLFKLAAILMCALLLTNHKTFTADSAGRNFCDQIYDGLVCASNATSRTMAMFYGLLAVNRMVKNGYNHNKNTINASILAAALNILNVRSKNLGNKIPVLLYGNLAAMCWVLLAVYEDKENYRVFEKKVCDCITRINSDYEHISKFLDQNKDSVDSISIHSILKSVVKKDLKALRALLEEIKQKAKTPELWQRYFEIQDLVEKLDQVLNIPIAIPEASVAINASC